VFDILRYCVYDRGSAIIYRELGLVRTDPPPVVGSRINGLFLYLSNCNFGLRFFSYKTILLS
jgi:hypothetical protein